MEIYADIDPLFLSNALRALIQQPDEERSQNRFQLGRWFPPVLTNSTDFEWFDKRSLRTFTEAMPFRAFDTEAPLKGREGLQKKSGQMIPLSEKYAVTELDKIKQMAAAAAGDTEAVSALDEIFQDIDRGVRALRARMEIAYAEVIRLGTVTIAENGIQTEPTDFARNANNTSTAAVAWSLPATADPYAEEQAALDVMMDEQDLDWDDLVVVTHRNTYREWAATDAVRNSFQSVRVQDILPDSELAALRRDLGLPPVVLYNAQAKGFGDSSATQLIPDGDWIYLPANGAIGATQFGTPAIAGEAGLDFELNQQPGPVAYIGREVDPLRVMTVIDALGFPVAYDINATYRLVV